jgi:hypothetical protein
MDNNYIVYFRIFDTNNDKKVDEKDLQVMQYIMLTDY